MLFKAISYITFWLKSLKQNNVNSYFISDLIKQLYKKPKKEKIFFFNYKQQLLNNTSSIKVTDFGAGSKIFKNNTRQISKIAQYAGISNKNGLHLINIVKHLQPETILEIGTSLGIATSALSFGNKKANITTLEGCPETAKIAQQQFNKYNLNTINLIVGDFKNTLPTATKNKKYDLIYFDGNHQEKATLNYFEICLQTITNNSVFIFDDIHWSKEMESAWKVIKQHPKVTTTIDTYQWGIIFFNKELKKENITIRV